MNLEQELTKKFKEIFKDFSIKSNKKCIECKQEKKEDQYSGQGENICMVCENFLKKQKIKEHEKSCMMCYNFKNNKDFNSSNIICEDCLRKNEVQIEEGYKKCVDCLKILEEKCFREKSRICRLCSAFLKKQHKTNNEKECRICTEMVSLQKFNKCRLVCNFCVDTDAEIKPKEGNFGLRFSGQGGVGSRAYLKNLIVTDTHLQCRECNLLKLREEYNKKRRFCKECERKYGRNYRRGTNTAKIWIENNKERYKELQKNYHENNKEKRNERDRLRYAQDEQYRIKNLMKSKLHHMMNKNISFIGLSADFLKSWYHFSAMSNGINLYTTPASELSVDHVFPLDFFDLSEEGDFQLAFDWRNTQRIKQSSNREKSNVLPTVAELKKQQNNLYKFLSMQSEDEPYIKTENDRKKYTLQKNNLYYYFKKLENKLSTLLEQQSA